MQYTIGIDSCKYGWIATAVIVPTNELLFVKIVKNLSELYNHIKDSFVTFIDMPIALPDSSADRLCDVLARRMLKRRASSVFKVPHISTLASKSFEEAKINNLLATGKSIPIQTWNILPKVREIRDLILNDDSLKEITKESHPELAFIHLNDMQTLKYSKHSDEGINERIDVLSKYLKVSSLYQLIESLKSKTLIPDLLDSLSLATVANEFLNRHIFIPEEDIYDKSGLKMQIAF